jgi:hypothetical protein
LFNQDFFSVKILLLLTKKYLLADREFMNRKWLEFLTKNKIDYAIPLRKGMSIKIEGNIKIFAVGRSFDQLKASEHMEIRAILWNQQVKLV